MLSDDVFRSRLETTIASLRYWVPQVADAARIEDSEIAGAWKLAVTPRTEGACAFELLLCESQKFDLMLAGETYEDRPIESLSLFLPLVEAISEGRVIQRRTSSVLTGILYEVESTVLLGDGALWRDHRCLAPISSAVPGDSLTETRHLFLPYRR
jgi:hypothetical protein